MFWNHQLQPETDPNSRDQRMRHEMELTKHSENSIKFAGGADQTLHNGQKWEKQALSDFGVLNPPRCCYPFVIQHVVQVHFIIS